MHPASTSPRPGQLPRMTTRTLRMAFLATGLAAIHPASAEHVWLGTTSSAERVAANWSNGTDTPTIPTNNDDVVVSSSEPNVLEVADSWGRNGNGKTTVSGNAVINIRTTVGGRFFNRGEFVMTGGTINHIGQFFITGNNGNIGTLNQSGGTVNSNVSAGWHLSDNNLNQLGTSYNMSGDAKLNVEVTSAQDAVNLRHVWFGKGGENAPATEGSTVIAPDAVGDAFTMTGGTASFRKTNDNPTKPSDVRISRNAGLIISGGSATFSNFTRFRIGQGPSTGLHSRVVLSGGSLTVAGGCPVEVANQDNGLLDISGGTANFEGYLEIGNFFYTTGTGTVKMSGGTLHTGAIIHMRGSLIYTGGEIFINDPVDFSGIINEAWFDKSGAPREVIATYDASVNGGQTHIRMVAPVQTGFSAWISGFEGLADTTALGDPDGDGISNLVEFVLNGDPGVASGTALPLADASGADSLVYTFTRRADSKEGVLQKLQYSADMVTWSDIVIPAASEGTVEITPGENGLETVSITLPKTHAVNGSLFVRLEASVAVAP